MSEDEDEDEDEFDQLSERNPPLWLHLLLPQQKAWRQTEILKGRDPDPYIEKQLRAAGAWPEKRPKRLH